MIVTLLDDRVIIEDDAGMNAKGVKRFLTIGAMHKERESLSPRFKRPRTGRYGVGRLSFLLSSRPLRLGPEREGSIKRLGLTGSALEPATSWSWTGLL